MTSKTPSKTAPNSMVAAATRMTSAPSVRKSNRNVSGWQSRAWDFYDTVGEFRYAADWVGAMLSKAKLKIVDADGKDVTTGPAVDILAALYGGPEGQSEMLKAFGTHLTVAGDLYLVGTTNGGHDQWQVVASTELSARGGNYYVSRSIVESDDDPFVMRLWRPHPRKTKEANAPSRAVLGILAEIDGLTKHVAAQIDSRITGAGILLMPSEMTFPTTPVTEGNDEGGTTRAEASVADGFLKTLQDTMSTAKNDQSSAEARTPLIVAGPAEYLDKPQLLKFWSDLDEHAIELRTEAIRRLGLGLDMPPEVLTGAADVNHWNMWAVDEAAIKVHAEPAMSLIAASLTVGYLRPLLEDEGVPAAEIENLFIEGDTSGIRLRPNRSQEAIELWDRGELGNSALLRETGFDTSDAPTREEKVDWFVRKVASGSTTPELVAQALRILGAPFNATQPEQPPTEARPDPSLTDHPTQDPPDVDETPLAAGLAAGGPVAGLLPACEQMVFRALERAGNRLKTRLNGARPPGVSASELYLFVPCNTGTVDYLLTDAWSHVERFCPSLGCAPEPLVRALDSYCRGLLTEQRPHDAELLSTYLALAVKESS